LLYWNGRSFLYFCVIGATPTPETFVREKVIAKDTFGSGSVWDVGFSSDPGQAFLFINDATNQPGIG
jgi:hypothetical protein